MPNSAGASVLSACRFPEPVQRAIAPVLTIRFPVAPPGARGCQHAGVPRDGIDLHLLRHADAGDALRWPGPDSTRPLSPDGTEHAERLAAHLRTVGFECDAVLTSPKVRARQTAQPLADAFGLSVILDDRLAGDLSVDRLDHLITDHGNPRSPVLVGHDPDFSELLTALIGAVNLSMKKGAFARLQVRRPLTAGTATLRWLLPPDALRHR